MINAINSSYQSLHSADLMNKYTSNLNSSMTRLTSGMRINSAADDPSAMAASQRIRDRIGGLEQATENVQNDSTILKMADNAYTNVGNLITKLRELAVKSADSGTEETERATLKDEATQILAQIDSYANLKYNDRAIFGTFNFQIGPEANNYMNVQTQNFTAKDLGIEAADTKIGVQADAKDLLDSFDVANKTVTKGALTTALDTIIAAQQKVGAYENTMGFISDDINTQVTNLQAADSNLRDVDVAKEMTSYVRNSVLLQTSQLILAQHNQNAFSVLNLLK